MHLIRGAAALAVLTDPAFEVPPVPAAETGVGWLRATVARFSSGEAHARRRALTAEIIDRIPAEALGPGPARDAPVVEVSSRGVGEVVQAPERAARDVRDHPVAWLAWAMGVAEPVVDLVRDVAQAYQPGTGDESRADPAVERLVRILGGAHDEPAAARIGILVQACDATATLIARTRNRPLRDVLRDDPPVRATRRRAGAAITVDGVQIEEGETVLVELAADLAFGAGPHRCPGQWLALAAARR